MKRHKLEIFSETSNYGIVKMPGRHFPGCVIQGDSLHILVGMARNIAKKLPKDENAQELLAMLESRLDHYADTLKQHEIRLPYNDVGGADAFH